MLSLLKLPRWLAGAILLFCFAPMLPAQADTTPVTVIHFSPGGSIGSFIEHFVDIEEHGGRVIIDGTCISSCTMVLGLIDHDRLCATPRGTFAFHTATEQSAPLAEWSFSAEGTMLVWVNLPKDVQDWLLTQGMQPDKPHPELIFTPATRFVKACE